MNRTSKVLAGIIGGTALGIFFKNFLTRKSKIERRGEQLSKAIDERWEEEKKVLEQTKILLEAQLAEVNLKLEKLN